MAPAVCLYIIYVLSLLSGCQVPTPLTVSSYRNACASAARAHGNDNFTTISRQNRRARRLQKLRYVNTSGQGERARVNK
jgi:hypothetical protein